MFVEVLNYPKQPSVDARKRHQDFLRAHGNEGRLYVAGKFNDESGGLVIWKVESMQTAEKLAKEDPYSKEGFATFVLKEWSLGFDYSGVQSK
ncbi:MAG: hypothetical protein JRN20_01660 [Nitrososphaerota archaeon]|nr:hypothetical protein [Nitrososphaerota archaeon]MDG6923804.1 hypothetical protein [Nitrososphaerota archaeon]